MPEYDPGKQRDLDGEGDNGDRGTRWQRIIDRNVERFKELWK